jgi:phosphonate transport system substrate-binding protein
MRPSSTPRIVTSFITPIIALLGISLAVAPSVGAATKAKTTKAKKSIPAIGKPCTKAQVGIPVAGAEGLLDCVAKGSGFVWKLSAAAVTTVAPTSVAAVAATTTIDQNKWPDKIIFAPVPAENAAASIAIWSPFVKALEKELGIKVEQVATSDYAGVIEGQLNGKIDLAMYGPFSYYLAKQAGAKIDTVAVTVREIGLSPSYQSYLVAKSDSSLNSINDVKGKKVCFVDSASTSGYLYPFAGLKEAGIDLKDISPVFAGGHDRSLTAVKAGTCDVGFAFDDMVNITAIERGLIKAGEMKTIWKSKPIPNSPLAVNTALPASLVKKIKDITPNLDALYFSANKLCPATGACNLGGLNAWVPVNDSFFQPIADVCKATNAPACIPAKK